MDIYIYIYIDRLTLTDRESTGVGARSAKTWLKKQKKMIKRTEYRGKK